MKKLDYGGLSGEVVTPDDPQYDAARQEWNRAIQKYPRVIVYCYHKTDVSNAIIWARKNDVDIRIRSGGHHYEGYSVGNEVLVIDISRMNGLRLDRSRNILQVQGGAKNRQLYEFVSSRGYPFPGGTCPTVGVSGYALGGGWGYSCRSLGLGCDSLLELELVDYTGNIIKASPYHHEDLFWACRGAGGGNFGVIVAMTFKLPPPVEKVTFIQISYAHTSPATQVDFLDTWQQWLLKADIRIGLNARVFNSAEEGLGIFVRGLFYGTPEEARTLLRPFTAISGAQPNLQYIPFLDAIEQIEDTYPNSEKFKSTGRFVHRRYSREELETLVDMIQQRPKGAVYTSLIVYALGGAVSQVSRQATAFYYRDARYILAIESLWLDAQYANASIEWVERNLVYIKAITKGSYVNFPYSELRHYEKAYWGLNAYRLQKVKRKYDPYNVFSFPQGIKN